LTAGACAAFTGECFERKFIQVAGPEGHHDDEAWRRFRNLELSTLGAAVVSASARKRASKAKAHEVLDQILTNAAKLSGDKRAPEVVDQIWVFGSLIDDEKPDVGDLDIVVTTQRTKIGKEKNLFEVNKISPSITRVWFPKAPCTGVMSRLGGTRCSTGAGGTL
jgi:predicted nucleotidyltransferase